eukprot:1915200-Amphidinium_carterae.1
MASQVIVDFRVEKRDRTHFPELCQRGSITDGHGIGNASGFTSLCILHHSNAREGCHGSSEGTMLPSYAMPAWNAILKVDQ